MYILAELTVPMESSFDSGECIVVEIGYLYMDRHLVRDTGFFQDTDGSRQKALIGHGLFLHCKKGVLRKIKILLCIDTPFVILFLAYPLMLQMYYNCTYGEEYLYL